MSLYTYSVTLHITIFLFFFLFVCYRFTKPQTFADCIGNELPLGWEEAYDKHVGAYYINHVNRKFLFCFCYLIEKVQRERPDTYYTRSDFIRNFMSRICAITCERARVPVDLCMRFLVWLRSIHSIEKEREKVCRNSECLKINKNVPCIKLRFFIILFWELNTNFIKNIIMLLLIKKKVQTLLIIITILINFIYLLFIY